MINKIYAIKGKMNQEFLEGRRVCITNLSVPTHQIIKKITADKSGYEALLLGIGQKKRISKPIDGLLKKLGLDLKPKNFKEVKVTTALADDQKSIEIEKILTPGTIVTAIAKSKGKGFAGVMKRWGFHGGPRTHGQSDRGRAPGSIARGTTPGRVLAGKHMAGHMGNVNVSVKNLKVIAFDNQTGLLKIAGPIPGNTNTLVTLKITKQA